MEENNNNPVINEDPAVNAPEQGAENGQSAENGHDYYERKYFEGDSLKELEGEDENEYLASFDNASSAGERKKSSAGKKRLILLISLASAAAILLALYFLVFREKTPSAEDEQYYALSASCEEALQDLGKDVTIRFAETRDKIESGDETKFISFYAQSFAHYFPRITVEYGAGGDYCEVICGGSTVKYTKDEFFNTLEDGTRYSFNGEKLYGKAVLEVASMPASDESFALWALPGYDLDGDTVGSSNRPFMYPRITRADVESIVITNSHGGYKVYRGKNADGSYNNNFYFENSELCSYDQELFASLIVDCTYVLTYGKISDVHALADYGLDSDESATAIIEVYTLDGAYHKILIGDKIPSSGGYYAKYYNKDFVYLLDSTYETDVMQPAEAFLNATLGYTVSQTNDIYNVQDLLIKYFDEDTDIYISKKTDLALGNAEAVNSSQTPATVLHDKTRASGDYTGWTDNSTFAGVKAANSSGDIYFEFQLQNYAYRTNEYSVKFGIVRDSSTKAVLPSSASVYYYDQAQQKWIESSRTDKFDQGEKSYKQYELSFTTETQVRYLRLVFSGVGTNYAVLDEITVYADGKDAIPNESVNGIWKIMSPESFIQKGMNYATPDTSSFSDILYGIVTLVGDEVAERNIYSGTEEEVKARFIKYGLDSPRMAVSYLFDGYRSYIYVSRMFEENGEKVFYAYSSISFTDENGAERNVSPQIIARVKYTTAGYFDWAAIDLLDRSAFSMYIDKIDTIEMSFGGNSYLFDLQDNDNNGKLDTVVYNGGTVDTAGFRSVYVSLLECYRAGLYSVSESDLNDDNLILTFTMHSDLKDTEIKFYRVTSSKVIYCTNGESSDFYVLYSDVSTVIENVVKLINGEEIRR